MRLLLDTCAFLWVVAGSSELSATARELFRDPQNEAYLSSVSAWEIAVKSGLGKLDLPDDLARFVPEQRRAHGILELPLGEAAVLRLPTLPALHRDPFDRMLICESIQNELTILTPDALIRKYPVRTIW